MKDYFADKESKFNIIVMEWAPVSLASVMKKKKLNDISIKVVAEQVGNAIAWVHSKNVVHFDVKPGNIVQDPANVFSWKLIDFDSAADVGTQVSVTGTPQYIAPEIAIAMLKSQIGESKHGSRCLELWCCLVQTYSRSAFLG